MSDLEDAYNEAVITLTQDQVDAIWRHIRAELPRGNSEAKSLKRKLKTPAELEKAADAAYERGWVDSLDAHSRHSLQPMEDICWYARGWEACAKYRWSDPNGRGVAPDRSFRTPRHD